MKTKLIGILGVMALIYAFVPKLAFAHQPRIVNGTQVTIQNPEVSQAFYGELVGSPVEFTINSNTEFRLYLGILVPDVPNVSKNFSVEIARIRDKNKNVIGLLNGQTHDWQPYFEQFAKDNYFWGPEFAAFDSNRETSLKGNLVTAGQYKITVSNPSNQGKYVLVVGELESFPAKEMFNALVIVPQLKIGYFHESLQDLIFNPFVGGTAFVILALIFATGLILRTFLTKKSKGKKKPKSKRHSRHK